MITIIAAQLTGLAAIFQMAAKSKSIQLPYCHVANKKNTTIKIQAAHTFFDLK